ncbi:MAG: hypothetical protein ACIAQZ_01805 [Sedimentisphaeraceae bacterium JB056]
MNLYILVEGKCTEYKIYPAWISQLAPHLKRVQQFDQATENCYYIVSGHGLPSLIKNHLPNAIKDVAMCGCYDYLVIGLDAEQLPVQQRLNEVQEVIEQHYDLTKDVKVKVLVQNRCIESWMLGNRDIFVDKPKRRKLKEYVKYYNVKHKDPEKMPGFIPRRNYLPLFSTIARFHTDYLQEIFKERNMFYAKRNPKYATKPEFLNDLIKRTTEKPGQLQTFKDFVDFFSSL